MMTFKSWRALSVFLCLCAVARPAGGAWAYGIDGLFGGQLDPTGRTDVVVPQPTGAQPDRAQTVLDHPRPDYTPIPMRVGSFILSGALESSALYNSNVYATPHATSDEALLLHPQVALSSDWSRNYLGVVASGDFTSYRDHTDQNMQSGLFQVDGRYDFANQTWLSGKGGYQRQAVPRSTLNNNGASSNPSFDLYSGEASFYRGAGLVHLQLDYELDHYTYDNLGSSALGVGSFDHTDNTVGGKVGYEVSRDFVPYVNLKVNNRSYASNSALSSSGYQADFGVNWDVSGVTLIDIYTGYLWQRYADFDAGQTISGADFGGKLTWNVTGLTTVVLSGTRSLQDSMISGANSYMSTGGAATLTHELLRNLLLEGDLGYTQDAYNGGVSRTDDTMMAGGGLRYLISRNVYTDLDYSWNHRVSTVAGQDYVDHVAAAKLGLRF